MLKFNCIIRKLFDFFSEKDLCESDKDNNCDRESTNCSSQADGTYRCSCKPGFVPSTKHNFMCNGELVCRPASILASCVTVSLL